MNKQTITFTADEQTLTKTGGIEHYASNIVSYIEASFTLGDNWAGYDSIRAVWESGYARIATVLDANNKCIVPAEVLTYKSKVNVNLVGSIVENTVLTDRLTTYPILALTVDADARVDSSETTPVTASQFEQFVDVVRDEASAIQNYTYDSEAWAVGQRAGVDVPSTDETYQNNAKYYADQGATLQQEVTDLKSDLDKAHKGENILLESGYFPASYKAVNNETVGIRYFNYDSSKNEFVFKYTGTSTGSQTVSATLTDSSLTATTALIEIASYPVAVLHVNTNVPAEANLHFRVFTYKSDGTTLQNSWDVPISSGKSDYMIDVAKKIEDSGWSSANSIYYRIVSFTSDSYSYTEKPYVEAVLNGFFTKAQKEIYDLADKYTNMVGRVSALENNPAVIGEVNLADETKFEAGQLNTTGIVTTPSTTAQQKATDFIKVEPNTQYTLQAWCSQDAIDDILIRVCTYDSDKEFIDRFDTRSYQSIKDGHLYNVLLLNFASGVAYVRISLQTYGSGKIKLERGNRATDWTNGFGAIINPPAWNGTSKYSIFGIIHRGCGEDQVAPENTLAGFIWGRNAGFEFAETDLRYTSDGVPVLLHDASINRTARNADGTEISGTVNIANITYAQALAYDFGIYKGSEYAGEKIPTFDELIALAKNIGLHIFIELKAFIDAETDIPNLIKILNGYRMLNHVSWIASDYHWLEIVRDNDPHAHLCLLTADNTFNRSIMIASWLKTPSNEVSISIITSAITNERIQAMKNNGISCTAYCPNTEQAMLDIDEFVTSVTSDKLNYEIVRRNSILGIS